jgi:hypothetical protein
MGGLAYFLIFRKSGEGGTRSFRKGRDAFFSLGSFEWFADVVERDDGAGVGTHLEGPFASYARANQFARTAECGLLGTLDREVVLHGFGGQVAPLDAIRIPIRMAARRRRVV